MRYYLSTAIYKAFQALQPRHHLVTRGVDLTIPGGHREAAYLVRMWRHDWKTKLLSRALKHSRGALIDVGANIGYTLLDFCAARSSGNYFGFEPNPDCIDLLSGIVRANRRDNCAIIPAGLSNENGLVRLYSELGSSADSGATIISGLRPNKNVALRYVACYRFDDVRESLGIDDISLIKIDVEGAELLVLEGASKTLSDLRPPIVCEVLQRDPCAHVDDYARAVKAVMHLLQGNRYQVHRILKTSDASDAIGFEPITEFPMQAWTTERAEECDYVFVPDEKIDLLKSLLPNTRHL